MSDFEKKTYFGNREVFESQKQNLVQGVFKSVASNYDLMNDIMSFRIHWQWKNFMMDWLVPRPGQKLLDVAGGTGDIAFRFMQRAKNQAKVTILDMTELMLSEGKKRPEAIEFANQIEWVCGDAMHLPFQSSNFDVYTISFGIRNVTDISKVLEEAYRVLRPGGRLMVLEFSRVDNDALRWVYDRYSYNIIPLLGKIIADDRDSYQYLVESIRRFPKQETFATMIKNVGFEQVKYRNLSLGAAALHSGWKI